MDIVKIATILVLFGSIVPARAGVVPLPTHLDPGLTMTIGEGCGAGRWRGPGGHCHWFAGPGGSYRGTPVECPPGFHISPGGGRCWPNR